MFLRKLFSSENKVVWVFVDLLIVIVGVYCAFLIQQNAEQGKTAKERDKIFSALKYELEIFRYTSTQIYLGQTNQLAKWRNVKSSGSYINFSEWRFIEPQYRYQIIEYSLQIEDSDIIDFDLYNALQQLFVEIKKVEHTESIITATASAYKYFPPGLSESSEAYKLIDSENTRNFDRFLQISNDRVSTMNLVRDRTIDVLAILNKLIDPEKKKSIEEDLIIEHIDELVDSEEEAVVGVNQMFPGFTEEEIRIMYQKATGTFNKKDEED